METTTLNNVDYSTRRILLRGLDLPLEHYEEMKEGQITNLILDLNQYCNYACLYCGNSAHSKHADPDSLTLKQRKKVISDSKKLGAVSVFFAGEGEPTLDPDFRELVAFNDSEGLITIVYTNVSTLDEELTKFLYEHNVSLVIKLDSIQKETYDFLIGVNSYYDSFMKSLENIRKFYGNQNPLLASKGVSRIQASMLLTKYNIFEIKTIMKYCKDEGYIFCCKTPGRKGSSIENWNTIVGEYEPDLQEITKKYTGKEQTTANIEGKCSISTYGLAVTRTGDIAVCESVREPYIGNVTNIPLQELAAKKQAVFNGYGCPACVAKYLFNIAGSTSMFDKKSFKNGE